MIQRTSYMFKFKYVKLLHALFHKRGASTLIWMIINCNARNIYLINMPLCVTYFDELYNWSWPVEALFWIQIHTKIRHANWCSKNDIDKHLFTTCNIGKKIFVVKNLLLMEMKSLSPSQRWTTVYLISLLIQNLS